MALAIRIFLGIVGAAFAFIGFRANAEFWIVTYAKYPDTQQIYVAISLAAGGIKYGLAVYAAWYGFRLWRERGLFVLFIAALVFDLISGLGYARLTRAEISVEQIEIATRRDAAERELQAVVGKLSTLAIARTVGSLQAELQPLEAQGHCDTPFRARSDRCNTIARLRGDLADAEARDGYEKRRLELREQLLSLPEPREADPQAGVIAAARHHREPCCRKARPRAAARVASRARAGRMLPGRCRRSGAPPAAPGARRGAGQPTGIG
jgi:hypothetical protein